ncbi:hypothetical protein NBO_1548g0001 [Nosema bombycis CQ1]|uniref:Uncharacterized protein n=1 Tax=Nosema bombycis (strain CQ1 / CVCC 102059) TaxID=578461 RepID=R0KKM3_NOSB1|nr:hypothetical protein NBO_1548g0001 [Nosema bombycis CQ1]|eukprot:EOB11166.1 hypothetical protein NBO_1548g0001 [Nosema bombycis CQ1]
MVLFETILDKDLIKELNRKSLNDILKNLRIKQRGKMILRHIHKLRFIMQKDFETIKDYHEEIVINLEQYAIIENFSDEEFERRLNESFFENLCFFTKRKLKDLRITEVSEALTYLIELEENLLDKIKSKQLIRNRKNDLKNEEKKTRFTKNINLDNILTKKREMLVFRM